MESTTSVSEGSFLFLPKGFSLSKARKSKKRKLNESDEENWEKVFSKIWKNIDKEMKVNLTYICKHYLEYYKLLRVNELEKRTTIVQDVSDQVFKKVIQGLVKHIKSLHNEVKLDEGVLPCEILLTGANLPDHNLLISVLTNTIKEEVTPYISVVSSRNCVNIKNTVSKFVQQIIPAASCSKVNENDSDEDLTDDEIADGSFGKVKLQASQYNMSTLAAWHFSQVKAKERNYPVVIFLPDFESFVPNVLSEFILLLSSYSHQVPMVLIFGVATTPGAVYQILPRNVLSQLVIQIFKSEPSLNLLNNVLEEILFSKKCPFRLGKNCLTFLTDIFLFHSFSVQAFVQGFKFCMMEHFYKKNHASLCCPLEDLDEEGGNLKDEDLESIRRIPSFQKFVENRPKEERKLLLLDTPHTKKTVMKMIKDLQEHLSNFHAALKCLYILTQDLPQTPLGRHVREYYCKCISDDVKECSEYKECIKLLHLQSRGELTTKINLIEAVLNLTSLIDILSLDKNTQFDRISSELEKFKKKFDEIGNPESTDVTPDLFETTRKSLLEFVEAEIVALLKPVTCFPLHEIILFDDLPSVRRRISGSPRSAIHLALNNPQYYLVCKCCQLPHPEAVLPTLPDLSIAYKLHLEFNKVINLYDWLQAFSACVKPEMSETEIDEETQARFTRAVSELQFLGFIKPSRSKSDYVTRLTWGAS